MIDVFPPYAQAYEELVTSPVRNAAGAVTPTKINFDLSPSARTTIESASSRVQKQISECDLKVGPVHHILSCVLQ